MKLFKLFDEEIIGFWRSIGPGFRRRSCAANSKTQQGPGTGTKRGAGQFYSRGNGISILIDFSALTAWALRIMLQAPALSVHPKIWRVY